MIPLAKCMTGLSGPDGGVEGEREEEQLEDEDDDSPSDLECLTRNEVDVGSISAEASFSCSVR